MTILQTAIVIGLAWLAVAVVVAALLARAFAVTSCPTPAPDGPTVDDLQAAARLRLGVGAPIDTEVTNRLEAARSEVTA